MWSGKPWLEESWEECGMGTAEEKRWLAGLYRHWIYMEMLSPRKLKVKFWWRPLQLSELRIKGSLWDSYRGGISIAFVIRSFDPRLRGK